MNRNRYVEWANQNMLRAYPFQDGHGAAVPADLIADLQLAAPADVGSVWISSIRVTTRLVSLTITSNLAPLAAATFSRDELSYLQTVALEPFGVFGGGWVTFGRLPATLALKGTSENAQLVDRAVRRMPTLPVTSIRKLGATGRVLQGVPRLESSDTVAITEADGVVTLALQDPTSSAEYLGPCQPVDAVCAVQPIRSINGVCASDAGVISIIIRKREDA